MTYVSEAFKAFSGFITGMVVKNATNEQVIGFKVTDYTDGFQNKARVKALKRKNFARAGAKRKPYRIWNDLSQAKEVSHRIVFETYCKIISISDNYVYTAMIKDLESGIIEKRKFEITPLINQIEIKIGVVFKYQILVKQGERLYRYLPVDVEVPYFKKQLKDSNLSLKEITSDHPFFQPIILE